MEFSFIWFKNAPIPLWLNRDKTKDQSSKNTTLTPTKTLPKKLDQSPINFQIALPTYKLNFQNKNYIYKIKKQVFFYYKKSLIGFSKKKKKRRRRRRKKPHPTCEGRIMGIVA